MSDLDSIATTLKNLKSQGKLNDNIEYIDGPWPGAFYRKVFDDDKIKVFNRGNTTKVFRYHKPIEEIFLDNTSSLVKTMNNMNLRLENKLDRSDECWKKSDEFWQQSNQCWNISSECWSREDRYQNSSKVCWDRFDECRKESEIIWTKRNDCFDKLNNDNTS